MILALVLLVGLALVPASTLADDNNNQGQGKDQAKSIPYDFFAVVNGNGTLARGTPGTTVKHPGAGLYNVTFPASVAGCAAVGNQGYAGFAEEFDGAFHPSIVTATAGGGRTVFVDVTFPGDFPPGPNSSVLRDNPFHLHVDCRHALFANVAADGSLMSASPGVTASAHVAGSGQYVLHFGRDISKCAPVGTVHTNRGTNGDNNGDTNGDTNGDNNGDTNGGGTAPAAQTYLALGTDGQSTHVSVNNSATTAVDKAFSLIVTCGEAPVAVFPVSGGFYNLAAIPEAALCALTANWYNSVLDAPSNQGYVATWATTTNTATVQTKNGGYGIQPGFGVDLVASC